MSFKQLLIGALTSLVCCITFAESEWQLVDTTDNGFAFFVDKNSINELSKYSSQATHKVWVKQIVYNDLKQDGLAIGDYHMVLNWVNCNDRTLGAKSITTYIKQKGGTVESDSETYSYPEMNDAIPGTIGEGIVNIICQ